MEIEQPGVCVEIVPFGVHFERHLAPPFPIVYVDVVIYPIENHAFWRAGRPIHQRSLQQTIGAEHTVTAVAFSKIPLVVSGGALLKVKLVSGHLHAQRTVTNRAGCLVIYGDRGALVLNDRFVGVHVLCGASGNITKLHGPRQRCGSDRVGWGGLPSLPRVSTLQRGKRNRCVLFVHDHVHVLGRYGRDLLAGGLSRQGLVLPVRANLAGLGLILGLRPVVKNKTAA